MDAAAQVAEVFDGLQTAARVILEQRQGRREEIAERLAAAAAHTTAHLVEVGEAEVVGGIDDDGVGIGDVNAVFHDGGGDENVVVVVDEAEDDALQFGGRHLAVARHDTGIGHVFVNQLLEAIDRGDAVGDDIHLAVAAHLEVDGVGNDLVAKRMYLRLDGAAVGRRCLDDGEIAGTHQRKLESAGNGRGRHGERIDVDLHLTQSLFDRHAELLLLVNDEQAQVFELHALADEFVRANDDVDGAVG